MRAIIVQSSDVEKCPIHSFSPAHYNRNGSCLCTDKGKWARMKELGAKWPKRRAIPTYPATMSEADKVRASTLYDSMSVDFVNSFGAKR